MKCPYCGHEELKVTDSRNNVESNSIRRRRECLDCGTRFTTFETVDVAMQVKKRDGSYEEFQQEKLRQGIQHACNHTKVGRDQVQVVAAEVAEELVKRQVHEVQSQELGQLIIDKLRAIDRVAYIRFACVYRRFKEIDEVMAAIESIADEESIKNTIA
jgi:transcriptional repressor NrdR